MLQKELNPYISLDLYPDFTKEELKTRIISRFYYHPEKTVELGFVGMINKRLIAVILKEAGLNNLNETCKNIKDREIDNIINILKNWMIPVKGSRSWMNSQVTAGGYALRI